MKVIFQRIGLPIFMLIVVPFIAHLLFSPLGFSPTDDGFTLAYSRRLLEGQIPHRDFIIIRPAFSPLLHTPIVLLGGEWTYWFSRLSFWFQMALIAWCWTLMIIRLSKLVVPVVVTACIALMIFMLSAHNFPIMAWHTVDGLMFVSLGLALRLLWPTRWHMLAYGIIGLSAICKQSFLLTAPLILIALADWKCIRYWFAALAPCALYAFYLVLNDAFASAIQQLTTQSGFIRIGLITYLNPLVLIGLGMGTFTAHRIFQNRLKPQFVLGFLLVMGVGLQINSRFWFALLWFGFLVGFTVFHIFKQSTSPFRPLGLCVLITAWSVSLSLGYNTPIFMSGSTVAILLLWVSSIIYPPISSRGFTSIILAFTLMVTGIFVVIRLNNIYREQSADNLEHNLGGIVPGMAGIYTNPNTFAWLNDLREATTIADDLRLRYAIIPDVPGWWAKSSQTNPLPIDWAQSIELNTEPLIERVINSLEYQRGDLILIVENYNVNLLAEGLFPLDATLEEPVARYVREMFTPVKSTTYFTLYR